MKILDKEMVAEKYLDILEIAVAVTKFCGYESKEYSTMIKSDKEDKGSWFRVIFAQRYDQDLNEQTYYLSTTIKLDDDNTSIASIHVNKYLGYFAGSIDKISGKFEGHAETSETDTYFSPNNNGELEVTTVTTEHRGHTNNGIAYDSSSEKTEVYEFDGNWKNLSSDMPKKGQENNTKVIK